MKTIILIIVVALGAGFLVFHPARPLYMQHRAVEMAVDDGVTLRGTVSRPRWSGKPAPGVVLVHGSGPLTREHLLGDTRRLVRLGFVVNHALRDAATGGAMPIWNDLKAWLGQTGILSSTR